MGNKQSNPPAYVNAPPGQGFRPAAPRPYTCAQPRPMYSACASGCARPAPTYTGAVVTQAPVYGPSAPTYAPGAFSSASSAPTYATGCPTTLIPVSAVTTYRETPAATYGHPTAFTPQGVPGMTPMSYMSAPPVGIANPMGSYASSGQLGTQGMVSPFPGYQTPNQPYAAPSSFAPTASPQGFSNEMGMAGGFPTGGSLLGYNMPSNYGNIEGQFGMGTPTMGGSAPYTFGSPAGLSAPMMGGAGSFMPSSNMPPAGFTMPMSGGSQTPMSGGSPLYGAGGQPMMGAPMMGAPMMGAPMMGAPMMGSSMMGSPMVGSPLTPPVMGGMAPPMYGAVSSPYMGGMGGMTSPMSGGMMSNMGVPQYGGQGVNPGPSGCSSCSAGR